MFQRIIDDVKDSTGSVMRQASFGMALGLMLFVTISFLCAAAFVYVFQRYGLMEACLAGALIFFVLTLIAAACYMASKQSAPPRVEPAAKSAAQTMLADPMLMAAGLQVVRAIGIKRLIPILAVGGLALGFLASRNTDAPDETPAE